MRNATVAEVRANGIAKFERVLRRSAALPKERAASDVARRRAAVRDRESESRAAIERGGSRAAGKIVGVARCLWKFAIARGHATRDIAQHVSKPRRTDRHTVVIDSDILSPAEYQRFLEHVPQQWQ